ncbi:insulinase family protein [archaeon]|jgi:predicted Zn-dependent peptidase|nr:insulinase family protein [archaeon]
MINFKKKVLKNGLTVLFEKRDVPVTTVMLAAKYGSAYESVEEKGMAHFIEHLCFKGTANRTVKQIAEEVERVGGDLNAFTHEEVTAYHVKLPSEHLDIAMSVISDVFFNAIFPEEEVEKEGNVICEEIKMYKDNPIRHTIEKIKENLYEAPFGMSIAGSAENVKGMSRDTLYNKHREAYVPSNSILCVVGSNDFEEVVEIAEKFSEKKDVVKVSVPKISEKILKDSESRPGVEQTNLAIGFHFPFAKENGRYAAELFSAILGQGMSSKLFTEVREKRGLVYAVKSDVDLGKEYGYMIIYAGTDEEKRQEVLDVCLEEFGKMGSITSEELEAAKVQVVGNRHVESEGSEATALNLILEEISGDSKDYYNYGKKIMAVSLADIKRLAKISKFSSFSLGP